MKNGGSFHSCGTVYQRVVDISLIVSFKIPAIDSSKYLRCVGDVSSAFQCLQKFSAFSQFEVIYPLVNIQKAIENGHRNSGLSH